MEILFGDKVKVVNGFYKGCIGFAINRLTSIMHSEDPDYRIEIKKYFNNKELNKTVLFNKKQIEKI